MLPDLCRVEKADEEDDITPVDLYGLPVYILVAMTIIFSLLVLVSKFTSKNVHKTIPNLLAFYGIVELSERLMLMAFLWLEKGEH